MRICLITVMASLFAVSAGFAQRVWTIAETPVYERPDPASSVVARIPVGTELTLIADQQDWLAISGSGGISGWIGRSWVSFSEPTVQPPPPPQQRQQVEQPPPPVQEDQPPPPPPRTDRTTEQPPPSRDYSSSSYRPELESRGFYNSKYWLRIGAGSTSESFEEFGQDVKIRQILPETSFGIMFGKYLALDLIGIGSIIDQTGDGFGSDALYSAGGGLSILGFPLSPSRDLPIGVYLEVRATADQRFDSDFDEQGGILSIGGGGGVYAHLGGDMLFIPKLALRYLDLGFYEAGTKTGDTSTTSVLVSVEGKFGRLVPGLFITFIEGNQIFGGSFTFAL